MSARKLTLMRIRTMIDVFKRPHNILPILKYELSSKSKQANELYFWLREIQAFVGWYNGEMSHLYDIPSPKAIEKVTGYSVGENAIRTWARVGGQKYLGHLMVPRNGFEGKKVLDVGCGPIPYAAVFVSCHIFGLEPLLRAFKEIGYPLGDPAYSGDITYIEGLAEDIPVDNGFFDVVISVNAIDHVDDFPRAAREIRRVIKPGGFLILEVHYHKPTKTEPWTLDDKACIRYFGDLGIKKIHDGPFIKFCASRERTERLVTTERQVIWSNYVHHLRLRNNLVMGAQTAA